MHGHCLDPHFFASPYNTEGYLAAVGDQYFLEHSNTSIRQILSYGVMLFLRQDPTARLFIFFVTRYALHVIGCGRRQPYAVSIMKSGCPYSTGWPPSTRTWTIFPAASDSISFMSFIASIMHSTCPFLTTSPTSTYGGLSGELAR